jgi:glycine cleavage system H protein
MEPTPHVSVYAVHAIEYLVAIGYLVLFVPFWKYVQGGVPAPAARRAHAPRTFRMPSDVMLHPGHGWVVRGPDDTVVVGLDDFARALVGPLSGIDLPPAGATLAQG